jgi:hypothetical protein
MTRWAPWCWAALLPVVGCGQVDDDGREPLTTGSEVNEGEGGALNSPGGAADGVEASPCSSDASAGGHGGAGDVELAAGGACGTVPEDGECAHCLATQCCSEWRACSQDEDCAACTECLNAQMDLGECVVMGLCDIAPEATSAMLLCGLLPCEKECGFD